MSNISKRSLLVLLVLLTLPSFGSGKAPVTPSLMVGLPIVFETNIGQAPQYYRFLSHHADVESLFSDSGVDLLVPDGSARRAQIGFHLVGSRHDVIPLGRGPLPTIANYLLGNDPSRWIRGVPTQSEVVYLDVYPGIDLIFHGNRNQIEHDFHVAPHVKPDQVQFSIKGAQGLRLDASGNIEVSLTHGILVFRKPIAYQESEWGRMAVESAFVLNGDGSVKFQVGPYDDNRELVIDPVFSFSTYLAGSSADYPTATTTDSSGNVYVTGFTLSSDFPIKNAIQSTPNGSPNAFVSKLDPSGQVLLYSTYIGGSSRNYGHAIALDSQGNIIVAGTSSSNDFPHVGSVPALTCSGNNDCFFIASLKPDGSAFNYAGLIGGIEGTDVQSGQVGSSALTVDAGRNAYLASVTDDAHFKITPGTLTTTVPGYPYNSTFVMKVAPTGALVYSTIIPGTEPPSSIPYINVFIPNGISVNSSGLATIAGTAGPGLPSTSGVVQPTFPNNANASGATAGFVLQLSNNASAISYATYVLGTDTVGGLAVDVQGDSYVTGNTSESNLPVSANAYQKTLKTGQNCTCNSGFILELNGTGTSVLAATYLEGTPALGNEGTNFTGIALDSHSNVYVGGMTGSTDFPLVDPFISLWVYGESAWDMVIAGMSPDLSSLQFGSFLSSTDQVFPGSEFSAIAIDSQNNLIVTGETLTTDFPTTSGAFEPLPPTQARHGFVAKLNMATAAPSVCLDTWGVNFGLVSAKTSNTQTVNLTNCGNAALNLTSLTSSVATVRATQTCGTIAAGSVCPIHVTYTPRDSSVMTGTLTLKDNAVISPQIVGLSGQGIAPQLSPSSGSIDFGHLLVNTSGVANALFFSNTGNADLKISSATVDGDFSITQNGCIGTLPANDFCVISVIFSPTTAGIRTGTLTINSNDPVYPHAGISMKGTGDTAYAVPVITALGSPTAQIKNGPITVQVYGANFYPASLVAVNGVAQATTYQNGSQIQTTLSSAASSNIGEVSVTVVNPTPGGGTSVAVTLTRYQIINVDAAFLTTVPGSTLLYASIPSSASSHPNTVIPINPSTGALGTPIPVGNNPGLLAPSSDGSYLFVVSNQDQAVQRINLSTKTVDRTFSFPPYCSYCGAPTAADLKGMPGSPQEVVLALSGYAGTIGGEMALYNDTGMVNYTPVNYSGVLAFSSFAYAGNPLTIYSLPFTIAQNSFFNIVDITAQGLQYVFPSGGNYGGNNTTGTQVVSDGSLLYTSSGEVWSPVTQTQVGSFPVTIYNRAGNMVLDSASGQIFEIGDQPYGGDSSSIVLSAFRLGSFNLSGALAFPQVVQPFALSLARWGAKGFAFIGQAPDFTTQQIYVLTSSLALSSTSNPVPHVASVTPNLVPQGSFDTQLTLNGSGFTEASVVKWNGVALQTTYVAKTVLTAIVPAADLATSGGASVTVANPAPGGGVSNSILFTIAPLTPLISFSSSTLVFSNQTVGTTSPTQKLAVQNPGTATLNISGITIVGPNASSFHQTHTCGKTLAPGANCWVSVTFKPTVTGPLSASLNFADNAAGSPQTITLSGTGN